MVSKIYKFYIQSQKQLKNKGTEKYILYNQ